MQNPKIRKVKEIMILIALCLITQLILSKWEIFIMKDIEKKKNNEHGATMVEYALMVSLIAIVCIAAVQNLGNTVSERFGEVAGSM